MGTPFRASEPTRRRLLRAAITLAGAAVLPRFARSQSACAAGAAAAVNPQPVPNGPMTDAMLSVAATSAGSVPMAFTGLALEKATLYGPTLTVSNSNLISLFKSLGTSVLRLGGNSVDENVWTPAGAGQTPGQIAPSDVTALAGFLKATGWQCIYGINLGGSSNGSTNTTRAAEEVAAVVSALGSSLLGIEIGNEPDQWGNSGSYYAGNWSVSQLYALWTAYRNAIVGVTPTVSFVGPGDAANSGAWTVPFAEDATKSRLSLITQHYYRGDGNSPASTAPLLIAPDATLTGNVLPALAGGTANTTIPFRIDEGNSFYDGGAPGVSNSYAATLWAIDYIFDIALGGGSGVNFQGGPGGSYSPIGFSSTGVVQSVNPVFYGLKFATMAGIGTLYKTTVSAGSLNVTGYTVRSAGGGLSLIISNKDSTQSLQLSIQLPQAAHTATLLELTQLSSGASGPSLAALSGVTIQGGSIGLDGTLVTGTAYTLAPTGTQVTCYVPALSAVLIQIS